MKRFLHVLRPIVALVCVFGIWGCDDNPTPDEPIETTFEIVNKTVSVAAEGGSASAGYKVINPVSGATVQANTEAKWISDFAANGTAITFTVEANPDADKRDATVAVTYGNLKGSFKVTQAAAGTPEPSGFFNITIVDLGATSVIASVLPEDKKMTYLLGSISTADLNTFPDDLAFVNEFLIPFYKKEAEKAGASIEELMDMALEIGDLPSEPIGGFTAEEEFCVFCIGMNNKMEILVDFEKVVFTTPALPEFDAELTVEVEGATASVLCTPANSEVGWYYALYEKKGYDMEVLQNGAQASVNSMIQQLLQGWIPTREAAIQSMMKHGDHIESYNLTAESDYTAIAFMLNDAGFVTSVPVVKEFRTGKPTLSENEITIEYTKVAGRKIEFVVWSTVDADPYTFFTYRNSAEWEAMTDDEIIERICELEKDRLPNYIRHGDVSSYEDGLRAETEYVTYAFGWEGGVVTTPLCKGPVTTAKADKNSSTFVYEYGPYYNGDEAAVKYPAHLASAAGKVVFQANYKVTGEWHGIWHDLYEGDMMDETKYTDEDIYQVVKEQGNPWMNANQIYLVKYDKVYTMCGFVETKDGNYSAIYRQTVGPFTTAGCSPIAEFVVPDFETAAAQSSAVKVSNVKVSGIFNLEKLMHPNKVKPTTMLPQTKLDTEKSKAQKVQKLQRTAKPTGITLYTVK